MVIGPYGLGLITEVDVMQTISELGLILLMFLLGISFSPKKIIAMGRLSIVGGLGQVTVTILLVMLIVMGLAMTFDWNSLKLGIVLGSVIALSSTAIVIKLLNETYQIQSNHGKQMVACLIIQDISSIVMIVVFPHLKSLADSFPTLSLTLLKASAFLLGAYWLNKSILPKIEHWIAEHGGRELFLIASIVFCLGMSVISHNLGLSFALGAFVAGLLVSESHYNFQIMAGMMPLRDIFLCIFFVALGLLFNPVTFFNHPWVVIALSISIMLGKFLITSSVYRISGVALKTALITGIGLAQIGEFSLVVLKVAWDNTLIDEPTYQIFISASIMTMFISPFAFKYGPNLLNYLDKLPGFYKLLGQKEDEGITQTSSSISDHVVICGFGSIGIAIAKTLQECKIEYLALDLNAARIKELRKLELNCFYGDASSEDILKKMKIQTARFVIVTVPRTEEAEHIIKAIKSLNPDCSILARSRFDREREDLYEYGASYVVQEEFVTGLEMLRTTMEELVIPQKTIDKHIDSIRSDRENLTQSQYFGNFSFSNLLSVNRVLFFSESMNKEEVIKKLVSQIAKLHSVHEVDELYKQVMLREAVENTGTGNGIAIPHSKTNLINQIGCVIGICPKGIEYDAFDRQPVHIIILLIANEKINNKYLNTLGNIAILFQDTQLIKRLKYMGRHKQVIREIKVKEEYIKKIADNNP